MTIEEILLGEARALLANDARERSMTVDPRDLIRIIEQMGELRKQHAEDVALFQLRWEADMAAIKAWQREYPGKPDIWPDRTDMVYWLIERWDKLRTLLVDALAWIEEESGDNGEIVGRLTAVVDEP